MKKLIVLVLCLSLWAGGADAAAPKEKAPTPDVPEPTELWLPPIWIRLESETAKPKSTSVVMRIVTAPGKFEDVCAVAPLLTDAIILEMNREPRAADLMRGRNKVKFSLEMTKFIKSILSDPQAVFSVEVFPTLPEFGAAEREIYNRCNHLPLRIIR